MVNRMLEDDIVGVEAWVVNTDAQVCTPRQTLLKRCGCACLMKSGPSSLSVDVQALANSRVAPEFRIQIGAKSTRGLGAGGDPEVGLVCNDLYCTKSSVTLALSQFV